MRVLLDTHVLLWALDSPEKLGPQAAAAFRETISASVVSVVSLWEIAIKRAAGKLQVEEDFPQRVRALGHAILPVEADHVWRAGSLPLHHRDPFDRLLIAQAKVERLPLVSHDRLLDRYGLEIIWA